MKWHQTTIQIIPANRYIGGFEYEIRRFFCWRIGHIVKSIAVYFVLIVVVLFIVLLITLNEI